MNTKTTFFHRYTRRIFVELCIVIVLVGFGANVPNNFTYGEAMRFAISHINLLLHMMVATLVIIEAVTLGVRTFINKDKKQIWYAMVGLFFILLAYAAGEIFMARQSKGALAYMSLGWLGALATYGIAWFKNRTKR